MQVSACFFLCWEASTPLLNLRAQVGETHIYYSNSRNVLKSAFSCIILFNISCIIMRSDLPPALRKCTHKHARDCTDISCKCPLLSLSSLTIFLYLPCIHRRGSHGAAKLIACGRTQSTFFTAVSVLFAVFFLGVRLGCGLPGSIKWCALCL